MDFEEVTWTTTMRDKSSRPSPLALLLLSTSMLLTTSTSTSFVAAASSNTRGERSFPEHFSSTLRLDGLRSQVQVAPASALELKCELNYNDYSDDDYEDVVEHTTEWLFIPDNGNESVVLSINGVVEKSDEVYASRLETSMHTSWDSVENVNVEEHFLQLNHFGVEDEGIYICQAVDEDHVLIASKHSLVTLLTHERLVEEPQQEQQLDDQLEETMAQVLGPIKQRFVLAKMGMSVVLECHDVADVDALKLHWRKHGDPSVRGIGRQLRLYRVDKWDSGEYYCATNVTNTSSSEDIRFNVTLRVDHPPRVIVAWPIVSQTRGRAARLSCRVEALPVPAIHWLKLDEGASGVDAGRRLHSDDNYGLTIDSFGDGFVEAALNIRSVTNASVGKYVCIGTNALGTHNASIELIFNDNKLNNNGVVMQASEILNSLLSLLLILSMTDLNLAHQ